MERWQPPIPACITTMQARASITIRDTPSPTGRRVGFIEPGTIVWVDPDDACLLYQGQYRYIRLVAIGDNEWEEPAYIAIGKVESQGYQDILTLEQYLFPHRDDCGGSFRKIFQYMRGSVWEDESVPEPEPPEITDDEPEPPEFPEELTMEWIEFELGKIDYALNKLHEHLGIEQLKAKLPARMIQTMQEIIVGAVTPDVPPIEIPPIEEAPEIPEVEEFPDVEAPEPEPAPRQDLYPLSTSGIKVLYNGVELRGIFFNLREGIAYDNRLTQWASPADLLRQLAIVQEIGGKGIRFYAAHQKLSAAEAAARAEHVLNLCQERGLFAIVALDEGAYSEFGIQKSSKNYRGRLTKAFYAGGYRDEYVPYVREVVKRIGNHPAIFCFEIANEPTLEVHPPDPTITELEQMLRWVKDASSLIREFAPHKLISPGWVSGNEMAGGHAYAGYKFAERVYGLENINLGCVHTYQGQRNLKWGDCQPNIEKEILIPNIPLYVGEIGLEPGLNDWGWLWRFANDPKIRDRFFGIAQWALMGHQGRDLYEVRQDFDIGTGDRVGMTQSYKNGLPGLYWKEYVNSYKELAKTAFK